MASPSRGFRRFWLAVWTAAIASLASLGSGPVSLARVAAAEGEGLGAGGAAFAYSYTFVIALVLAFILGFGIRDVLQKRAIRAQARKKAAPAPKRA